METLIFPRRRSQVNKFKSYYVVWKLGNPALTAIGAYGLNRTM